MSLTKRHECRTITNVTSLQDRVVTAHLEDLQSEIEAGSRQLDTIAERALEMRNQLLTHHLEQAALAGSLVRRIVELRKSVMQQRERLSELRRAIRNTRQPA